MDQKETDNKIEEIKEDKLEEREEREEESLKSEETFKEEEKNKKKGEEKEEGREGKEEGEERTEDEEKEEKTLEEDLEEEKSLEEEDLEETEEKMNDVEEIIENEEENKEKKEEEKEEGEKKESKKVSAWKIFSGILLVLLIVAVYSQGFRFKGLTGAAITKIDAEDKVLQFVNGYLLPPAFAAEVVSSEEMNNLFKITLKIGGEEVDSYLTKDGRYFFPRGFDLENDLEELRSRFQEEETKLYEETGLERCGKEGEIEMLLVSLSHCPFCNKFEKETLPKIKEKYGDKLKLKVSYLFNEVKGEITAMHGPEEVEDSYWLICAQEQGKWYEYDLCYRKGKNKEDCLKENNLDEKEFKNCLKNKVQQIAREQIEINKKYKVTGTPTVIINCHKKVVGAQPWPIFEKILDEEIGEKGKKEEIEEVGEEVKEKLKEKTEETIEETKDKEKETTGEAIKEIKIGAKKWRFFDPADPEKLKFDLVVKEGEKVKLILTSFDVEHSFELPAFGVSQVIPPQKTVEVIFTADKKGEFVFTSQSSSAMKGTLVVK